MKHSIKTNGKFLILFLAISIILILPASFAYDDIALNQSQELSADEKVTDVENAINQDISLDDETEAPESDVLKEPGANLKIYADSNNGTDAGTGSIDNPVKSISQALNLVNDGGTIYLSGKFSGEGNSNITFDGNPTRISFVGIDEATIDGNSSTTFATVTSGTYSFTNINFTNHFKRGEDRIFGGVIENGEEGSLTFTQCIFENNTIFGVNRANGGAIDNSGMLIINNCSFICNTANVTNSSGFRKNSADGGAISNLGKLYIYNTIFADNTALRNGGAIRTQDGAYAEISNCRFEANAAEYHLSGGSFGGALYTWDCSMNLTDSIFINNRVYDASGYGAQGGAISSDRGSGKINILSCQFINNTADGIGTVNGQSIYIGVVTESINYCTIDTSIYSVSQSTDLNYNWWVVNDTNIGQLIENLPPSVVIRDVAVLRISTDGEEIEAGKTINITASLCWNATNSRENISMLPTRTIYLTSNCGAFGESYGEMTGGLFKTTLTLNNADNPTVTANVDGVIVKADLTKADNETKVYITCEEIFEGETAVISIRTNRNASGLCLIDVDGFKYYAELSGGFANASIPNLDAGVHNATIRYLGDGIDVANSTAAITVKNGLDTKIIVIPQVTCLATDYGAGERGELLNVTLQDVNGNVLANRTVQIALNGNVYSLTTDKLGHAGLRIDLASANVYTYAASFNGDGKYRASPLAAAKLTVVKKSTSIAASSKAFKVKAVKSIQITLRTVKNPYDKKTYLKGGKKVTLTVNGKTYIGKTTSKGIAKFTVKLTKKGKYTAKIRFGGDATYKASAKTIKITVK